MSNRSLLFRHRRPGATSPVVVILLAGILLAIVVLIVVLLTGKNQTPNGNQDGHKVAVDAGQKVSRNEIPKHKQPKSPEPIGKDRIVEVLRPGKRYEVLMKGGFTARVEDKDWGVREITNLAFGYEMPATRTIESNDGKTIMELRHFGKIATAKFLTKVESVTIDLGVPGDIALGLLE